MRPRRALHPNVLQRQRKLPLADRCKSSGFAGQAQGLQLAAPLLAAGLAETLLGGEVIAQFDAAAVMQQPLQPGERGAVLGFVAATPRFGLQKHQSLQPFALQQPMGPADGVVLPGQVPEAR